MSNWLTRFHTAAARLDAAPSSPPEMPDAVFDALVEGRIGEIDDLDTLTPLEEEIPFADARPTLAQRPITALALAMLCRALPAATDVARLVRPGEITILSCHPAGLAPDLARLLQDLIGAEHPGSKVALTCAAPPPGPVSDPQSGSPSGSGPPRGVHPRA